MQTFYSKEKEKRRKTEYLKVMRHQTEIVSLQGSRVETGQVIIEETMSPQFPKALKSQNLSIQWAP